MADLAVHYKDARDMSEVKDKTIQTIVTSPPYWNIKKYSEKRINGEIGYGQVYEEYLESLTEVWRECYRVLKEDGTLWINVGNKFCEGRFYPIPNDVTSSVIRLNFLLRNILIWHKPNALPIHSNNNLTNKYEQILFFSRGDSYKFRIDRVRVPQKYRGKDWGGREYKMNPKGKDPGNVWTYSPRKGNLSEKINHPAPFPKMIPERIILATTDVGDWVLDPFLGSGTTLQVCHELDRNGIGYEINPKYKALIESKVKADRSIVEFVKSRASVNSTIV